MSEYECTEHLLDEIERLREANFELREVELRQRIKQLEAVVNDPEALWTNWLRGTVKLPSGIGDVRQYQERIKRLEDWKESALAVEREWNANAIATMLGGQPGESQREVIQREVPKLLERIKRLEDGDAALTYSIGLDLQKENEALKARIKRLEEDLGDAYAEMRKQWPVITAVFDRSVWLKAKKASRE